MANYNIRFTLRRLWRERVHTFLHLLGLTLGITVCLLIGLFIQYEHSFDAYHEQAAQTYRVNFIWEDAGGDRDLGYSTPGPVAAALEAEVPGIASITSVYPKSEVTIAINPNKRYLQSKVLFAEPSFFDVFDVEVVDGDVYEAMRQPWHTVLTASTAQKFFGRENPIGKTLTYEGEQELVVAGVIQDLPNNTHLPAEMLISYVLEKDYLGFNPKSWTMTFGASTYITLEEGVSPTSLEAPIQAIFDTNFNDKYSSFALTSGELQPLQNIHFEPQYNGGGKWVSAIEPEWLWFFGVVGTIVLGLACINFINLSTAQSLTRAKEISVRKVVGAARGQLIRQFLSEAFLLTGLSSLFAIGISFLALPYINSLLGKAITLSDLFSPIGLAALGALVLTSSLVSGIYPAWLITKFRPAGALKTAKVAGDRSSTVIRKVLITTQFALSGAMLIALILIYQQMQFFYEKNLGFDQENIVNLELPDEQKMASLSNALSQLSSVKTFSFGSSTPSSMDHNGTIMHLTDIEAEDAQDVTLIFGDDNYPDVFDLKLLAGRTIRNTDTSSISTTLPEDQRFPKVLANEQLVQVMGFNSVEEAIGKRFKIGWFDWQPEIVGVVQNFVTSSLHETIEPALIFTAPDFYGKVSLKLQQDADLSASLASVRSVWEDNFPDQVWNYEFLDQRIAKYYETENLLFQCFTLFAGLAMLISCLGLWGLATYFVTKRKKEIGIRKVLGASINHLVSLATKDFIPLVVLALLIATPITWYFISGWLQNFAYRIDIQWWVFVLAGATAIGLALLTISFQSVKAALANPVDSLRDE